MLTNDSVAYGDTQNTSGEMRLRPWVMRAEFAPIQLSLSTTIVVLGLTANIALLAAIVKSSKLHTAVNLIVVSMCCLDIWRMVHILSLDMVSGITGRWQYNITSACTYSAFMVSFVGMATGLLLCLISVNRVLMITRHEIYKNVFSIRNTIAVLVFVFLASVASSLPVTIKGIEFFALFSRHVGSCYAYDASSRKGFMLFGIFGSVILPSAVMIPSYSWIYFFVRRSKRRVGAHGSTFSHGSMKFKEELRSAIIIFLAYISYFVFYVPLYASYLCSLMGINVSNDLIVIFSYFTDFHRFIRPTLYPCFGISYKNAFAQLFSSRHNAVQISVNTGTPRNIVSDNSSQRYNSRSNNLTISETL